MRRIALVASVMAVAIVGACSLKTPPVGPQAETPYAVLYGHVAAPAHTQSISVLISAYVDSAHAIAGGDTSGYAGNFSQAVDTANNYTAVIPASPPGFYFLNVVATGQGRMGFESSTDTVRALRVRFDSAAGGPHDPDRQRPVVGEGGRDPVDPLRACHTGEGSGGGALAGGEVLGSASTHRVDQVIRHVHAAACAVQRFRTEHVTLVQIEARALKR